MVRVDASNSRNTIVPRGAIISNLCPVTTKLLLYLTTLIRCKQGERHRTLMVHDWALFAPPSQMHWGFKATLSKCRCSATLLGILRMYDNAHWTYESDTRACRTFYAVVHSDCLYSAHAPVVCHYSEQPGIARTLQHSQLFTWTSELQVKAAPIQTRPQSLCRLWNVGHFLAKRW